MLVFWVCQELLNFQKKPRYEQVMTWYETSRNWKSCTGENKINIIWPGDEFEKVNLKKALSVNK
jgi:hypothetical protein